MSKSHFAIADAKRALHPATGIQVGTLFEFNERIYKIVAIDGDIVTVQLQGSLG